MASTALSVRSIVELMQVDESARDINWLGESLQNAVDLELATLPVYLTGMWSIKAGSGEVFDLIDSVVREEMVHLGLTANMLKAIGDLTTPKRSPQFNVPAYPSPLPGGVRPDLTVYLAGLTPASVWMYMQIELPEHPLALVADTFPTIGAFYDAILAAFKALQPSLSPTGQQSATISVPNPDGDGSFIREKVGPLTTLSDVEAAITLIKDQGEGTSTSPDAPEYGGELAHYYRFGEIYYGKTLKQVDGKWQFAGDPVPFPDCWPVAQVPAGGYPGVQNVADFDKLFTSLIGNLTTAWAGGGSPGSLNQAVDDMFGLAGLAEPIMSTQLPPPGVGNYGPDFKLV